MLLLTRLITFSRIVNAVVWARRTPCPPYFLVMRTETDRFCCCFFFKETLGCFCFVFKET